MLLYAGANVRATTRIGGYTPLHLASQIGNAAVDRAARRRRRRTSTRRTATGATALMLAARVGQRRRRARAARERRRPQRERDGQRPDGADVRRRRRSRRGGARAARARRRRRRCTSTVVDLTDVDRAGRRRCRTTIRDAQNAERAARRRRRRRRRAAGRAGVGRGVAGVTRPFNYNELIGKHGGLAALHFAARQGALTTVRGAGRGRRRRQPALSAGDTTSPLLIAAINGQFDLASYLLETAPIRTWRATAA